MKKAILWLFILFLLGYAGVKFGHPYYKYLAFKDEAKAIAKLPHDKEEEYWIKVLEKIEDLNLPVKKEDIKITKMDGVARITASWYEVVDFFGYYQKTLYFKFDTQE